MAITKVPNGPLIKKKGPYAGSTLKNGGKLKKAQGGEYLTKEGNTYTSTKKVKTKNGPRYYQGKSPSMSFSREIASDKARKINDSIPKAKLSARALEVMNNKNGGTMKNKAMMGNSIFKNNPIYKKTTEARGMIGNAMGIPGKPIVKNGGPVQKVDAKKYLEDSKKRVNKIVTPLRKAEIKKGIITYDDYLNSKIKNKAKSGAMIKRADGSMSRRGLWDNIRANKGSGKKPTAAMLKQERKIKAKTKK
jgi:hypothetical protein